MRTIAKTALSDTLICGISTLGIRDSSIRITEPRYLAAQAIGRGRVSTIPAGNEQIHWTLIGYDGGVKEVRIQSARSA